MPARGSKVTKVRGSVEVRLLPDVLPGQVAALPRVISGPAVAAEVAAKINIELGALDRKVKAAALDCRRDSRRTLGRADAEAWQRQIAVTMRGPRFLSYRITDSYFCGGPYPNFGMQTSLVYDLESGSLLDWARLLPPGAREVNGTAPDGSGVMWVEWPPLVELAKRQATADCKDVFDGDNAIPFWLDLDARSGSVVAVPSDFPHVVEACAEPVKLDVKTLRSLGVSKAFIDVLSVAHKQHIRDIQTQ